MNLPQLDTTLSGLRIGAMMLLPVLLALSAACSASETALFSLTHADRLRMRRSAPASLSAVQDLLDQPRSLLVAILLANVTINTAYFTLAGIVADGFSRGSRLLTIALGIAGVLTLILFGEVLPKAIASVHRVQVCRVVAFPVRAWYRAITPIRIVLDRLVVAPLARLFRPAGSGEPHPLNPEELELLLDVGESQGVLHAQEQQLLADVVAMSSLRVKDIMCPRVDIAWLDATHTSQELLQIARESGWSRFPVCRGALNEKQVVGMVNVQRVLPRLYRQGVSARMPLTSLVEPPVFFPERAGVDKLLDHFRATRTDVALVVSELGELTGLVQVDDVIAELVKFAASEDGEDSQRVVRVGPDSWEVPGRLSVRDWEEYFEPGAVSRSGPRVSTVAGLMLARLGRVPRVGDEVRIGAIRLSAQEVHARSIVRVGVRIDPATGGAP
jgi:putative hemolysin